MTDGSTIVFDTISNDQSPNISYNGATGEFTVSAPGNYFASWWVAVDGSEGPINLAFAVEVDGGGGIIGTAPTITGQINGSALLTITTTPAVITLVNVTGASIVLADNAVQANMVIVEIS